METHPPLTSEDFPDVSHLHDGIDLPFSISNSIAEHDDHPFGHHFQHLHDVVHGHQLELTGHFEHDHEIEPGS